MPPVGRGWGRHEATYHAMSCVARGLRRPAGSGFRVRALRGLVQDRLVERVAECDFAGVVPEPEPGAVGGVGEADAGVGVGEAERTTPARRAERLPRRGPEAEPRKRLDVPEGE